MTNDQYFPHDASAGNNGNLIRLIHDTGMEGYGIYWALLEFLRVQKDYLSQMDMIEALAEKFRCKVETVKKVIENYHLFIIEESVFFSPGLCNRMTLLDEKRKKLSEAGQKGNAVKALKKKALERARQATAVKESRERKEEKVKTPPPTSSSSEEGNSAAATDNLNDEQEKEKTETERMLKEKLPEDRPMEDRPAEGQPPIGRSDRLQPYLGWEKYIDQLANEQVWLETTAIHSGMKMRFIEEFPQIQAFFKEHIRCQGKESHISNLSDAKSYLYNFIINIHTRQKLLEALKKKKLEASPHTSPYEQRDKDGNRSYNGIPIPADAPPRPNDRCFWNESEKGWDA